jgi:hypothetical protein
VFAEMEVPRDEADARLRAAEKLLSDGCPTEADEQLQRALTFYRSVGATRYVREAEGLLTSATAHDLAEKAAVGSMAPIPPRSPACRSPGAKSTRQSGTRVVFRFRARR